MKKMKVDRLYKLFIYLVLIVFSISIIIPLIWVFMASIKESSEFLKNPWLLPKGFYIKNYINAFKKAKMAKYAINSFIVVSTALVILVVTSIPAAYCLARFEFKGRKIIKEFIKAGMFINVSYIVIPIFLMMLKADNFLRGYHIIGKNLFLNNLFVLSIIYVGTSLPFTIYILTGFFETLSRSYEEAAYIDGAGYFTTMVKVMAPMATPSIVTIILFNFLSYWNEYILALTFLSGDKRTLPVGLLSIMVYNKEAANYGTLYAGLVIAMLPILIIYILLQKRLTESMSIGGSKG